MTETGLSGEGPESGEDEEPYSIWEEGEFEYGEGYFGDGYEVIAHPEEYDDELIPVGSPAEDPTYNATPSGGYQSMKYISPVRNQGSTGLCWMFGAISALESHLREKYGLSAEDELDLSEKFGAWWIFHNAKGSLGGFVDDDWDELRYDPNNGYQYDALYGDISEENGYIRRGGNNWFTIVGWDDNRESEIMEVSLSYEIFATLFTNGAALLILAGLLANNE